MKHLLIIRVPGKVTLSWDKDYVMSVMERFIKIIELLNLFVYPLFFLLDSTSHMLFVTPFTYFESSTYGHIHTLSFYNDNETVTTPRLRFWSFLFCRFPLTFQGLIIVREREGRREQFVIFFLWKGPTFLEV